MTAEPAARPLAEIDRAAVAAVARLCGETGPVSAASPGYLDHVARHGRWVVSENGAGVVGFGGVVDLAGTSYLTDLFVHPEHRDAGHGRAVLEQLWGASGSRATSSSQDPRALASYARFGARPLWPLLYLEVPAADVSAAAPVTTEPARPGDAGWPLAIEGSERHTVLGGPSIAATTAVVLETSRRTQVLRARTPDPRGLPVLVALLRSRADAGAVVALCVPGPHPALPDLLAMGARVVDTDLWCATPEARDLVDPTRELPSPALA